MTRLQVAEYDTKEAIIDTVQIEILRILRCKGLGGATASKHAAMTFFLRCESLAGNQSEGRGLSKSGYRREKRLALSSPLLTQP